MRWPWPTRPSVSVLGYHRVDTEGDDLAVLPATFARHMRALAGLAAQGLPALGLDEALDALASEAPPARATVLTFDDAWADNHEHAFGPLVEHGLPAVVYAPSRLLDRPGYMSRAQLVEMCEGGITIGAHSRTHPDLRQCSDAELEGEIRGSKDDLEELLGRPVTSFAYPTGLFDDRVERVVARAGFRSAVTTHRGWLDRSTPGFRIPRSFVEEYDEATFVAAARGGLTALRPIDAVRNIATRA